MEITKYKLPTKILGHRSWIDTSGLLNIVGGCKVTDLGKHFQGSDTFWKLKIAKIDWNIERIVWIGYFKNKDNICLLASLPRDIILFLLTFLRGSMFDN